MTVMYEKERERDVLWVSWKELLIESVIMLLLQWRKLSQGSPSIISPIKRVGFYVLQNALGQNYGRQCNMILCDFLWVWTSKKERRLLSGDIFFFILVWKSLTISLSLMCIGVKGPFSKDCIVIFMYVARVRWRLQLDCLRHRKQKDWRISTALFATKKQVYVYLLTE